MTAELVDSSDLPRIGVRAVRRRSRAALQDLGRWVSVWEIGNEVNGSWTGRRSRVAAKTIAAYRVVHRAAGRTALTLYENARCGDGPRELPPVAWSRRYLPVGRRRGLTEVLLFYYETQCHDRRPGPGAWTATFRRLRAPFPSAELGFGEVGLPRPASPATAARARSIVRYYYGLRPAVRGFVGGCFYWYFAEDMTPWRHSRLYTALRRVLRKGLRR